MKNKKSIKKIPKSLINDFTLNGEVELIYEYSEEPDIVIEKYRIREENIKKMVEKIKKHEKFPLSEDGMSGSSYPALDKCFYGIVDTNDYDLKNKNVLIIGTSTGWYESFVLAYGGIPHVVEYIDVEYDGEQIKYYKPEELSKLNFKFDFCISFSSYEHDGLGRYGDPIDPNGDLKSMRELKTVMKEDGILFLAVPVGLDRIVFNLHRIYGKARLPLLLENWKFIGFAGFWFGMVDQDFGHGVQPVLVLENTNDSKYTNEYYEQLIYFMNKFIEELPTPYQTE
jgi:SAM-dependent methyltransferase